MLNLLDIHDFRSMKRDQLQDAIRSRTQIAYLGEGKALCRVLGRYKFFVDTRDIGFASHVMLDGFWEMWLTQFMARHVKPGMTVIDIGANFGYYSLLLSDLVSHTGRCICIEANPAVAECLEASLSINGFGARSTIVKCAAGDGSQVAVSFYIPHREPKNGQIVSGPDAGDPNLGRTIEVPCTPVDALCGELDKIDFIKIDAEGAEPAIFRGMDRMLSRHRPDMILEFNYLRYSSPGQFIDNITSYYPTLRYLDFDGSIKPVSADRLSSDHPGEDWLLFLSDDA